MADRIDFWRSRPVQMNVYWLGNELFYRENQRDSAFQRVKTFFYLFILKWTPLLLWGNEDSGDEIALSQASQKPAVKIAQTKEISTVERSTRSIFKFFYTAGRGVFSLEKQQKPYHPGITQIFISAFSAYADFRYSTRWSFRWGNYLQNIKAIYMIRFHNNV